MHMIVYGIAGAVLILVASFLRRTDKYEDVSIATFILVFVMLLPVIAFLEGWARPLTWDARLRVWDLALGLDGFALSRWCNRHNWAIIILSTVYYSLPLIAAASWVFERSRLLIRACIIGGLLTLPFYLLVPACGPHYSFAEFPWRAEVQSGLIAVSIYHPRNCFPSMHLAWAILLFVNAGDRRWKTFLGIYAILTAISAVASGEHYVVDMIAAVPFALAVQALAEARLKIPLLQTHIEADGIEND